MHFDKKIIKSLLVFLCVFSLLFTVSCKKNPTEENSSVVSVSTVKKEEKTENEEQPPEYPTNSVSINGVSLSAYEIVYDGDNDYSRFAAENLKLYIENNYKNTLKIKADFEDSTEYEISVGDTNRDRLSSLQLSNDQYAFKKSGNLICLKGNSYMIGGAVRGFLELLETGTSQENNINATMSEQTVIDRYVFKDPKNVLLYIGDGMGHNHINWAMDRGMAAFYAAGMPNVGEAVTYSYSVNPLNTEPATDSAAAGTAMATGYKTVNGLLGLNSNYEPVKNIRELADEKGAKTAVLTTDVLTGATPSAFMVHYKDRTMTYDIQMQINELFSKKNIEVAQGSLDSGILATSQNTLYEISEQNSRFFMMLEEAHIDKYSHSNNYKQMISSLKRFNEVIANAMVFTLIKGDTILIVTADHETGGVIETEDDFKFTSAVHTNRNVPLYAIGKGTEVFNGKSVDNTYIAKFIAGIFGETNFGG